jgi:hypothetical protein
MWYIPHIKRHLKMYEKQHYHSDITIVNSHSTFVTSDSVSRYESTDSIFLLVIVSYHQQ